MMMPVLSCYEPVNMKRLVAIQPTVWQGYSSRRGAKKKANRPRKRRK